MMRAARPLTVLLWMPILIVSACAPLKWRHPNFESRQSEIRRIAVLPIDIDVYKLTFTGEHEEMVNEEKMVRINTIEEFERALQDKGYTVTQLDTSPETLNSNPMLRDAYHKVKGEFGAAMRQMSKGHNKEFKYNVGPEINILADAADCDALLFVMVAAFKKSGGQIAKDVAKTLLIAAATLGNAIIIYDPDGAFIQIAVIDGDNGDILWYNRNVNTQGVNVMNEAEADAALRGLVKGYPSCTAPKQLDDICGDAAEPSSSADDTGEDISGGIAEPASSDDDTDDDESGGLAEPASSDGDTLEDMSGDAAESESSADDNVEDMAPVLSTH